MIDRRKFLQISAGTALGITAIDGSAGSGPAQPDVSRIRRHVRLGRTELQISDISFGSASSSSPALVQHAFERGVNYFDTAESYRSGNSEEAIGVALAGKRAQVLLGSKTKAGARDTGVQMMRALEGSLRRLQTDYLDVYFNHAVNDVARMQNEAWWEFTERAKQQGKIRFRGMSGHGSHLVESLDFAIEQDLVDVILVAYNLS